ncbi:hypothetical protein MMC07_009529 [Pseudocyphellaria aurata]|nr:hypothetical protein [Pseudocyphellaria aurata]
MASSKLSTRQSIRHSLKILTGNTVHVKIHPRPRNLAESREVLRVLQQYGEVVMYKHLKYEPESPAHNTALAIYQNTSSAEKIINASPLSFELEIGNTGSTVLDSNSFTNDRHSQVKRQGGSSLMEQQGRQLNVDNNVGDALLIGTGTQCRSRDSDPRLITSQVPVGDEKWDPSSIATVGQEKSSKESSSHHQPQQFTPNPPPVNSRGPSADIPMPPPLPQRLSKPTPPEFRKFHLKVSRSYTNHESYIERQGYYGGFSVDTSTIMAEDLQDRVPMEGMADCQLKKPAVSLWVKDMKKDRLEKNRSTLRQMWEEGRRERGEI